MKTPLDPRANWWYWREVSTRLVKWTLALLRGKRYTVRLEPEGSGCHDPLNHIIQANPQLFPTEAPEVQFRLTQGILAHEAGHAWFTSAWPDQQEGRLQEMSNILEDERIERAMCGLYPGVAPVIRLLGDHMLANQKRLARLPARDQAYACCLIWRWASGRSSEAEMFDRLGIGADAQRLWAGVKPLVERAWEAVDTGQVIELGRTILERLGIDPRSAPLRLIPLPANNIPLRRADEPLPFPSAPAQDAQPGLGKGDALPPDGLFQDQYSEPAPYLDLEDQAHPLAARLALALQLPTPDVRPEPHESQGRYSFRQEARTPETPHLLLAGVDESPRDLALYLLVDRSGSMCSLDEAVRLALMSLYLAAMELEIPCGLAFFGASRETPGEQVLEATPPLARPQEPVKALIAGFAGRTHYEFLDWGLQLAEQALLARPERRKTLIVLHDGDPVYEGRLGNDRALSQAHLSRLERLGVTVIGVYLGSDKDMMVKLQRLFPRLVVSAGADLPERLGNLLRSLA